MAAAAQVAGDFRCALQRHRGSGIGAGDVVPVQQRGHARMAFVDAVAVIGLVAVIAHRLGQGHMQLVHRLGDLVTLADVVLGQLFDVDDHRQGQACVVGPLVDGFGHGNLGTFMGVRGGVFCCFCFAASVLLLLFCCFCFAASALVPSFPRRRESLWLWASLSKAKGQRRGAKSDSRFRGNDDLKIFLGKPLPQWFSSPPETLIASPVM